MCGNYNNSVEKYCEASGYVPQQSKCYKINVYVKLPTVSAGNFEVVQPEG